MTWKQFKDALSAKGIKDSDDIDYIDINGAFDDLHISRSKCIECDSQGCYKRSKNRYEFFVSN